MPGRFFVLLVSVACLSMCIPGCGGEKGAKVTGVIVANGQPIQVPEKEIVLMGFVPVQKDENSVKANPGAEFKRDDASFLFVGPGLGLVPPGEYKVVLTIRPRGGPDRFAGKFSPEKTPLTYTVTNDPKQHIVIDVEKKTVTRP